MHPQSPRHRHRNADQDRWIESDDKGGGFAGFDEPPRDPHGPQYLSAQYRRAQRIADATHGGDDYGYGGYGHMGQADLYSPRGMGGRGGDALDYRRLAIPHAGAHPYDEDPMPHHDLRDPGTSGRYFGIGPKNYTRADERIFEEVCELLSDADVDASEIDVRVENGEVTLEGSVHDRWSKREAENVACGARGVKDCHNRLRIAS
ncbi:MAG TPA: BON domain-containing protein [Nannocystaceae bacterium]|nr:BON domain-containing protein [Nannocystaceae bacterium]